MSAETYIVPSHYIRVLLERLVSAGYDVEAVHRKFRLSTDVVRDQHGMVLVDQFVALAQYCWHHIDDEFLGLTNCRCEPGHFALMVRYVYRFDTLSTLLKELCRFYNTTRDDLTMAVEVIDDQCHFRLDLSRPELDKQHYLHEFMIATLHRLFCWITGKRIFLDAASFPYPEPAHVSAYSELFPCDHKFEQAHCSLVFSKEYLLLPLVRSWPEVREFLRNAPADLMFWPGDDDRLSTFVKATLLEQYRQGEGFADFKSMAEKLCVSPQTLRRKLQHEQRTYQQIKDLLRRDIAIEKLIREKLPVAEIGQILGYVEPASFTRAFKQWTGLSPAEYRVNKQ